MVLSGVTCYTSIRGGNIRCTDSIRGGNIRCTHAIGIALLVLGIQTTRLLSSPTGSQSQSYK